MIVINDSDWDAFLEQHPEAHLLQTSAWGRLKSQFGWSSIHCRQQDCGVQILFRKLPLGFTIGYIPKGPIGENWQVLQLEIDQICRQNNTIFLIIEPDILEESRNKISEQMRGYAKQVSPVQPRRSIIIDLAGSESHWLERMKQKTRYNIRLAEKKEIDVHISTDIDSFYQLMIQTGQRDGFGVHSKKYYQLAFDLFSQENKCVILQADYRNAPLAALMIFSHGARAWYFYGASNDLERSRMPTYLLQFEAMRWAASRGCIEYDLWGIPDADLEELEARFSERSDGLWGVYRFKRGFGGHIVRSVGAWNRVYNPFLYWLYQVWSKRNRPES
jgi:peptidoglycan pentaglycine glycine transferase (the first glycine)